MKIFGKWLAVCMAVVTVFSLGFSTVSAAEATNEANTKACVNVTLYEHINYGGRTWSACVDSEGYRGVGWFNDMASSLKVSGGCVRVFEHAYWGGRSLRFCQGSPDLGSWGFNDMISSLRAD
ncbi:beta/gamma crystallin-related protein [Laceyella sacchari]|uniref:Beta/gamma crystallin-related protein n=1 Tax=Laceyella sacchari TaxID=37482 RepID=A0ABY5U0V8_LACSH|nr:beta/gamma crystallin-related protein [Laceyella sacchari]UWE03297.1 beta/gamma crystallin-related protein [Laceyella sacchari]